MPGNEDVAPGGKVMKNDTETKVKQAVVFELEHVGANGHAVLYDVMTSVLKKKGITLTGALFARYCLDSSVEKAIARVVNQLGKKQPATDALAQEIAKEYVEGLLRADNTLPSGLRELVRKAVAKGMAVGAVSCLGDEEAQRVAEHLGLASMGVAVLPRETDYGPCVTQDEWEALASLLAVRPLATVALASNSAACKAALAAGMHVVARPGKFADFGDFSGADLVLDNVERKNIDEILSLPELCSWS